MRVAIPEKKTVASVKPKPRKTNIYTRDGKALVSQVTSTDQLKEDVARALDLIGGLNRLVRPGDTIMLKPNLNTADPFPASSDAAFVRAVVELVKEAGARRVVLADSSATFVLPTKNVAEQIGLLAVAQETGADFIGFEEADWVDVEIGGHYLGTTGMPKDAYEADKIIYLPCMKTHQWARFTLSLKLPMGFVHPSERRAMHQEKLEEKLAEINLAWQPDLCIMDGRKSFITGGPARGDEVQPNLIMASADQIALDVEALKVLTSYEAENRLDMPIWEFPQIATAVSHGLGARSEADYELVKG